MVCIVKVRLTQSNWNGVSWIKILCSYNSSCQMCNNSSDNTRYIQCVLIVYSQKYFLYLLGACIRWQRVPGVVDMQAEHQVVCQDYHCLYTAVDAGPVQCSQVTLPVYLLSIIVYISVYIYQSGTIVIIFIFINTLLGILLPIDINQIYYPPVLLSYRQIITLIT